MKECKDLIKGIIISPKFIYHKTKLGEVVKVFYSPNANSLSIRSYDTHIILEASTLTADRAKRRIDSVRRDAYAIASIVVNDDVTFDEAIMIHTNRNNKG